MRYCIYQMSVGFMQHFLDIDVKWSSPSRRYHYIEFYQKTPSQVMRWKSANSVLPWSLFKFLPPSSSCLYSLPWLPLMMDCELWSQTNPFLTEFIFIFAPSQQQKQTRSCSFNILQPNKICLIIVQATLCKFVLVFFIISL